MNRSFAIAVVALIGTVWITGDAAAQFPPCAPQVGYAGVAAVQVQQQLARPMLAVPTLTPTIQVAPLAPIVRPAAPVVAPVRATYVAPERVYYQK